MNGYLTNVSFNAKTDFDFQGAFDAEIKNCIDCIKGRAQCIATADDGIEMMKFLDAVYKSAKTCHEIIL